MRIVRDTAAVQIEKHHCSPGADRAVVVSRHAMYHALAQRNLGIAYAHGQGVSKDWGKANWLWRLAAGHGASEKCGPTTKYHIITVPPYGISVPNYRIAPQRVGSGVAQQGRGTHARSPPRRRRRRLCAAAPPCKSPGRYRDGRTTRARAIYGAGRHDGARVLPGCDQLARRGVR
ncbi:hypothetical protein T492DRAFT_837112 [Pavlovales sp. CCMP2436]|nr:hypothetical protein T492DRAFT_837112 [Pavlovales sp. CCMP2436]